MSNRTLPLNDELYEYLLSSSLRESDLLRRLRQETAQNPYARMQISPEQGQFLAFLVKLIQASKTIEIGVFTGYSSLCVALALPEDGRIVACDISEEYTSMAQRYWREAGIEKKIELHLAPALKTLDRLFEQGQGSSFDLVFIDADKENYIPYYECSLRLVRAGGLIVVDNVLWGGSVIDEQKQDAETKAIREFNKHVSQDPRVELSMLPLADGVTLALRK